MDSTTGPPPTKEGVNGAYRFGCVTLLGALFLGFGLCIWGAYVGPPGWTPVRMPIRLTAGQTASAEFTSDQDAGCAVLVDLKRRLPFDQLAQISPPELSIQVSSNGRPVSFNRYKHARYTGESASSNWDTWGDDFFEQVFGNFNVVTGRRYTIQVGVRQAVPKLRGLDPHLVVNLSRGSYADEDLVGAVGVDLVLLLLLIGIPSLIVGIRRMR